MIFKSKISLFFIIIATITILLLVGLSVYTFISSTDNFSIIFAGIIAILVTTLLLSLLVNTNYKIQDVFLKYRSGPFFGQIKIEEIRELQLNTTKFVGLKIALASNGITIKYNKWDEIYISPKDEHLFVKELIKINPNIITNSNNLPKNEQF